MDTDFLSIISQSYPDFIFKPGKKFTFRPPRTIFFEQSNQNFEPLLLHELGHALLHHTTFATDVERLKMERAAWDKALLLADKFSITIDEDFIEAELDTYRDWLHAKSRCQKCGLTRYQTRDGRYHCPLCDH